MYYFGSVVAIAAKRGEPFASSPTNCGRNGHRLYVGDGRRTAEEANVSRKWRFKARFALFALQRLDQCLLLCNLDLKLFHFFYAF